MVFNLMLNTIILKKNSIKYTESLCVLLSFKLQINNSPYAKLSLSISVFPHEDRVRFVLQIVQTICCNKTHSIFVGVYQNGLMKFLRKVS